MNVVLRIPDLIDGADFAHQPVAVKTCKVDDDSMAEKFLEEACKQQIFYKYSTHWVLRLWVKRPIWL